MSRRFSYKILRNLLKDSEFAREKDLEVYAYSGYYHLKIKGSGEEVTYAETPKELWEKFCLIRSSYYAGYKACENELKGGEENDKMV